MSLPKLNVDDALLQPGAAPTLSRAGVAAPNAGPSAVHVPASPTRHTDRAVDRIESRFRQSGLTCLSFYLDERGKRVRVQLTRSAPASTHVSRVIERDAAFHGLSVREHEVASAVALGFSNEEISHFQGLSKRTVDTHMRNILARLGFHNRSQVAALVAASSGWMAPFAPGSALDGRLEVVSVLGPSPMSLTPATHAATAQHQALHVGSLLPDNPHKRMEAVAMSQGEDLALAGTPADRSVCQRFPVSITRVFSADDAVEQAVSELVAAGIGALTIGNFDIATAERILQHPELRGIPVLHSMVNRHVHSFTDPDPKYSHVFQMCADESVYLRALAAYRQKYVPHATRISVIIRDSDNMDAAAAVRTAMGGDEAIEVQVIRLDDQHTDPAKIVLELLQFQPQIAYLGIYVESTLTELLAHIRRIGIDTKLFGVWVPGLPGFTQRHPEVAEGLVWSTLVGNSNNYFGNQFRSSFEAKYRSSPGIGSAAVHYDMIALLRRAWQDTGVEPSPELIIEALNSVRFTGVTGSFHFDGGRQRKALCFPFDTDDPAIGQPCLTFEIRDTKSVPISLLEPAASQAAVPAS